MRYFPKSLLLQYISKDLHFGQSPVDNKRKSGHSPPEKSSKFSKTLGLDDEECDGTDLSLMDGSRALSASRILRDLKQPAAPPSEANISTVVAPFFKSPRRLNDNLCLFFSGYNVLDADKRFAFCKGNIDYPEEAFLQWAESNPYIQLRSQSKSESGYSFKDLGEYMRHLLQLGYIKSYLWKNLSKWNRIPAQLLYGEKLIKYPAVIVGGLAPSSEIKTSMLKKLRQHMDNLSNNSELEKHKDCIREYHQISQKIRWNSDNSCEHAIGVRRFNGQTYIFDTGRKSALRLNSVLDLAWSLGSCCDWYSFDVSL
jgi:hypothetical protein